jgi:organic radical activating enzyme
MPNIIEIKQKIPALYLTWIINNICTNACSYCPTTLHNGTNHNYDWEDARKFIKLVLEKYPKIHLAISGGEPTLSPWFKDLVKMFSDAGHPVGITTNGARTVRYFDEVSQYLSYVVMSYHPSFIDPELEEKALACAKHTLTTVSVMMDSRYFEQSLEMFHRLCKHDNLSVEHVRIQSWRANTHEGSDYTPEQIIIMDSLVRHNANQSVRPKNPGLTGAVALYDDGTISSLDAQKIINGNNTNFQGWECNIGLESLYVKWDGVIRRGNCISSPVIGILQNIDNILWPINSFVCPQTFCNCTTDVYVSKRKL